jgi:hypothetical protein
MNKPLGSTVHVGRAGRVALFVAVLGLVAGSLVFGLLRPPRMTAAVANQRAALPPAGPLAAGAGGGGAPLQAEPIEIFTAPSHIPTGEHWVFVGSGGALPPDLAPEAASPGVAVLAVERLSEGAMAVRASVTAGAQGSLLRVVSALWGVNQDLDLRFGQAVPQLSTDANFRSEDLADGWLVVKTDRFLYGYLSATDGGLGAVRIHNRATGGWSRREHAAEAARAAAEAAAWAAEPLPEGFVEPNELETLPDTDGDGLLDFEEAPELREAAPEFLGVRLQGGENLLDLVTVDEHGSASWRLLRVYSTSSGGDRP